MSDYVPKILKKTLGEDGTVKMKEKPNFYTNPAQKGHMRSNPGIFLGREDFKWKKDEYARKR